MATAISMSAPASVDIANDLAQKLLKDYGLTAPVSGSQDQQDYDKAAGAPQPQQQQQQGPKKERDPAVAAVEQAVQKIVASIDTSVNPETGKAFTAAEKLNLTKDLTDFTGVVEAFVNQRGKVIDWQRINPPPEDMIVPYAELAPVAEAAKGAYLDKLVVLKLNGGLGTTMGCVGPKSAIEVHSKHTFLDLIVQQITVRTTSHPSFLVVLAPRFMKVLTLIDEETDLRLCGVIGVCST